MAQQEEKLVVRIKASDPDYPAIELALRDLGVVYNPECWFGIYDLDHLWNDEARAEIEAELRDIFDDLVFKELTHELD